MSDAATATLARLVVQRLTEQGLTLATAESITGGLVSAEITAIPGASIVFRGGVVAYTERAKETILGVNGELLSDLGAVNAEVAESMATNVAQLLGSDFAVATTGAAGPDAAAGGRKSGPQQPGVVFIAVFGLGQCRVEQLYLTGLRDEIRRRSVQRALLVLDEVVRLNALNEA